MIKLIASDMDSTLLDGDSKVPGETFELIRAGAYGTAAAYILLSAALGVLAAALAMALVK